MLRFSLRANHLTSNGFSYLAEMRYLSRKVKDFREINQYTCILLHDGRLIIEEKCHDISAKTSFQIKHSIEDVEEFKTNQRLMVLKKSQSAFSLAFFGQFREFLLGFNSNGVVLDFKVNECFLLVLVKNVQEKGESLEAYFLSLEDYTERHQPQVAKFAKLTFPESFEGISSYSISKKMGYFVSQNHELFEVDLSILGESLKIKKSENFTQKNVKMVFSGDGLNFAVENKEKKSFSQFSNEEVVKIAEKIGLDDYLKILKYSKVKGKDLVDCSDDYLRKNFGLKNHVLIQNLRKEMKKFEKNETESFLHFWGDNSNKQFNFPKNKEKIITKPEILPCPNLKEVEEIIAFNDITYLVGSRGDIRASIPKDCQNSFKKNKGIWMDVCVPSNKNDQRYFF